MEILSQQVLIKLYRQATRGATPTERHLQAYVRAVRVAAGGSVSTVLVLGLDDELRLGLIRESDLSRMEYMFEDGALTGEALGAEFLACCHFFLAENQHDDIVLNLSELPHDWTFDMHDPDISMENLGGHDDDGNFADFDDESDVELPEATPLHFFQLLS